MLQVVRVSILVSVLLAACSGGGTGGAAAVVGLSLPDQMSVVTAGGSPIVANASVAPDYPADADYNTDEQHAWVYDPSMDTLGTVNQILCMLKQTGYADLVNQGAYIAQIDEKACEQGSESGDDSQSTASNAKQPSLWVVDSSRADNASDQIVKCWVPNEEDGNSGPMSIWVKMVVSEGTTPENPFGVFVLNFAGVPEGGTIADAKMRGTLRTLDVAQGLVGFSFYMEHGDVNQVPPQNEHAEMVQGNVRMSGDLMQGYARIHRKERSNQPPNGDSGIQEGEYTIAFDPDHFLRSKDGAAGDCLSRTQFDTRVWRYNLYDAGTGSRIERNSGFGFRTEGGDYGWIGYWGLWVPEGVELENGDTVTRDVYGQSNPPEYTLVLAPGKLMRNTKRTLALVALASETFQWWDFSDPNQPAQHEVLYRTGEWLKTGTWNPATQQYDPIEPPVAIDVATLGFLGMWSPSLGGQVSYVNGDAFITYYAREFVNASSDLFTGGATEIDLYGYFNCLASGVTKDEAEAGQVFEPPSTNLAAPYHYVFRKDDLTLYYDTDGLGTLAPAGLAAGAVPRSGPFTWGMQSGPMLTSTGGLSDPWQCWSQDVFYTYETGANHWNRYAAVNDGNGDSVAFDPPIQFTYLHALENDRNDDPACIAHSYLFGYGGEGNLYGIPSEAIDLDGDGNPDRWYPLFSLVDGIEMGPTGDEYVIKAIEMEQTLSGDPGQCSGLDAAQAGNLPLPTANGYTPPDIGERPAVEGPPRVIEGVVQGP